MKKFSLKYITDLIEGKCIGEKKFEVQSVADIRSATRKDITFFSNPIYKKYILDTAAGIIIIPEKFEVYVKRIKPGWNIIVVKNSSIAFAKVLELFKEEDYTIRGVHENAIIEKGVKLGKGISIYPFVYIGKGSQIGDNTILYPGVCILNNVKVGKNCLIYPNVSIYSKTSIGNNVIIGGSTTIGSDGFGFIKRDSTNVKIPQIGRVVIEDNVELGSNVSVDRATFGETIIGKGTKIDNFVQIAHNVRIGKNCLIVAQTGIAGSAHIGNSVTLAAKSGVKGHIEIGDNVIVTAKAAVMKSVPEDMRVAGFPARSFYEEIRTKAYISRLPEVFEFMKSFEKSNPKKRKRRK